MFHISGRSILAIAKPDELYAITAGGNITPVPRNSPTSFYIPKGEIFPTKEEADTGRHQRQEH